MNNKLEGKLVEAGEQREDEVATVTIDKASAYYDDKYFQAILKDTKKTQADVDKARERQTIQVTTKAGIELIGAKSENGTYGPNAIWGRYLRTYGAMPVTGQKVKTISDDNGYFSIYLVPKKG